MKCFLVAALLALCFVSAYGLNFGASNYDDVLDITKGETLLRESAKTLQAKLGDYKLSIVTAESLTAGKIMSTIVDVAGFGGNKYGGFAVYDSDAKRRYLGVMVPNVYSESCARQMARGALKRSRALVAVAVTGHAAQDAAGSLGNVDLAISIRTKATKKAEIEAAFAAGTALYAGSPVEGTGDAAGLKWGVPSYDGTKRASDSGDYATYHVHLAICKDTHGFTGTHTKCADLSRDLSNRDLGQKLRDVVRRTVVYVALELTREVLEKAYAGKDVDSYIKASLEELPASTHDGDVARHHCWEPSGTIRRYLANQALADVKPEDKKCHEQAHVNPADIQTTPDFLEEDAVGILRANY